ncbi:MAG: tRNA (cytidine(34)-2'-O)-methyltransferase [Steroidobacteraceae bacterium]
MLDVILYQPEIPPNTGNVIRLCANSGCRLHLIEPLGFQLDRRSVRRAGLDYHELTVVQTHQTLFDCLQALGGPRLFAIETGGQRHYSEALFSAGDALLFGSETRGLPHALLRTLPGEQRLSIPMQPGNRSLNLSNAVAVVVYEAWRQNGFTQGAAGGGDAVQRRARP